MLARALRLLVIVVVSVSLGYFIGSGVLGEGTPIPPVVQSPFLVSNLYIQPAEVLSNEVLTITISVVNVHDTWGIYSLVLKINGVKETEKQVNMDARSVKDVSFSVAREKTGRYSVFINGLNGSFTVVAPAAQNE